MWTLAVGIPTIEVNQQHKLYRNECHALFWYCLLAHGLVLENADAFLQQELDIYFFDTIILLDISSFSITVLVYTFDLDSFVSYI